MDNNLNIIKNFIRQQGNPKDLLINFFMTQNNQNPMINNLIGMAKKGDNKAVERFVRNICKEHSIDFDTEFHKFMSQIKK